MCVCVCVCVWAGCSEDGFTEGVCVGRASTAGWEHMATPPDPLHPWDLQGEEEPEHRQQLDASP